MDWLGDYDTFSSPLFWRPDPLKGEERMAEGTSYMCTKEAGAHHTSTGTLGSLGCRDVVFLHSPPPRFGHFFPGEPGSFFPTPDDSGVTGSSASDVSFSTPSLRVCHNC